MFDAQGNRCRTKAAAAATAFCQAYRPFSSRGLPDWTSSTSSANLDHWQSPPRSLSRTSISCRPSQLVPSPTSLSDHTESLPFLSLCSSRNASPVPNNKLAIREPGLNLALSTPSMASQLEPKPPYVQSS